LGTKRTTKEIARGSVVNSAAVRKSAVGESTSVKKNTGTIRIVERVNVKTEMAIERKFGSVVLTEPIKKHNDTQKRRISP
jgi:hypothetical protein